MTIFTAHLLTMATYHSYRSAAVQKRVLRDCIPLIRSTGPSVNQGDIAAKTVGQLHEYLNALLIDADLSKVDLDKILDEMIAASHNVQGTIPANRAKLLQTTASVLVEAVKDLLAKEEMDVAWPVLSAVLFHFDQAYWRLRRNLGSFRPLMEALEILVTLADDKRAGPLHAEIFDFCHRCYRETPVVNKVTLKSEWLFAMAYFVRDEQQEALLTELCNTYQSPYHDDAEAMELIGDESLQVMRLLFSRRKSRAALKELLLAHLHDDYCRKKAVAMAVEDNDHAMAIELCHERIRAAWQDDRKLYDWYRLMLDSACTISDAEHVLFAAKWLFNRKEDIQYYRLIRQYTEPWQWAQQSFALIEGLRVRKNAATLLQIFVEENRYERMGEVLTELGTYEWFRYEKLMADKCPHILEKHFDIPVWNWLKWKMPAVTGQDIVDYLQRMRARFGDNRVLPVVQLIKAMYPRRTSLHEWLDTVLVKA